MGIKPKTLLITLSDNADHQEVIYSLFEELLEHKQDVYALGIKNPKVEYINSSRISFFNAPKRPGICKGTFNLFELCRLLIYVYKGNFDVIYFETLHVWNIPIWYFHAKKTKIIQVIHDVDPHEGDKSVKSIERINKLATRLSDIILLRSKKFVDLLSQKYNISKEKIRVLDPWRRFPKYSKPSFLHRGLFFGRINNYKGAEYLKDIVSSCPEVSFDIVGKVDESESEYINVLRKLQNVNLDTNYVTDSQMKNYFLKADFVILPYKTASQSGVILDANKFGRPPIAFGVGAINDQIDSGINGIIVEPGNVQAFIKEVKFLADYDKEELRAFSESTYEYGLKRYSSKSAAIRFMNLLNEV